MRPPEETGAALASAAPDPHVAAVPAAAPKRVRAFELDFLRGFAVVMMMLHHLAYDLRYEMGLPVFAFQEKLWFIDWVRAPFVMIFLGVSGICGTFTRSNAKRGARLLGVALLFSAAMAAFSLATGQQAYIVFNVLHLLAAGTLLYALLEVVERSVAKREGPTAGGDAFLLVLGSFLLWAGEPLLRAEVAPSLWLVPIGRPEGFPYGMSDYMPLIPWLGFFLIGAVIGRLAYRMRASAFPRLQANPGVQAGTAPLRFVGRHALAFYIFHQPVLLGLLFALRALRWI